MRFWLFLIFFMFGSWAVATNARSFKVSMDLKSFREWKVEKVRAAQNQVDQTRIRLKNLKYRPVGTPPAVGGIQNLEQQLAQEEWNLEIARDLAVTDYLVLYLAPQGGPARLAEAAGKMSPLETAQVLEAYIRSVGAFPAEGKVLLPASALQGR